MWVPILTLLNVFSVSCVVLIFSADVLNSYSSFCKQESLLRERKRQTACRVASTRYAAPIGGTPPSWDLTWMGVPPSQVGSTPELDLGRGYPLPEPGKRVPPAWTWEGGTPPPETGKGIPPAWTWEGGTPHLDLGMGRGSPPPSQWMGYPPPLEV